MTFLGLFKSIKTRVVGWLIGLAKYAIDSGMLVCDNYSDHNIFYPTPL